MSHIHSDERLSRIATQWTLMFKAHERTGDALGLMLERYAGAVYRYLLGAVRDPAIAEELAQEFALRFLRGDFRRANPERGRFRNYLKTALVNLVNDYHRNRLNAPGPLPVDTPDRSADSEESDFATTWREEILERTWQSLAGDNPTYHATLLLRVQNPDMASAEMATQLSTQLGKPINAALVRKTLQRAQEKFAALLLKEVTSTLEKPMADDVKAELQELDLLRYCRSELERRAASEPEA